MCKLVSVIYCFRERREQNEVSEDDDLYLGTTSALQAEVVVSQVQWNTMRFKTHLDLDIEKE